MSSMSLGRESRIRKTTEPTPRGRKSHIRMRTELNALESPISECKQNLRNSSSPSENPLDQPIKNPAVTHLRVQVPAPLCRVYLDPSVSLLINPRALASVLAPWWFLGFAILGTTEGYFLGATYLNVCVSQNLCVKSL